MSRISSCSHSALNLDDRVCPVRSAFVPLAVYGCEGRMNMMPIYLPVLSRIQRFLRAHFTLNASANAMQFIQYIHRINDLTGDVGVLPQGGA